MSDFSRLNWAQPFEGGRTHGISLLIPPDFQRDSWINACLKKLLVVASTSALFLLGSAMVVSSADIVGTIVNPAGAPITDVTVSVQNQAGAAVGIGVTDDAGHYVIHGLVPGTYTLISRGHSAVAYVGDQGITVDWGIAPNSQMIAVARQGTGQAQVSSAPERR